MAQAAEKDPQVGKSSLVSIGKREALYLSEGECPSQLETNVKPN